VAGGCQRFSQCRRQRQRLPQPAQHRQSIELIQRRAPVEEPPSWAIGPEGNSGRWLFKSKRGFPREFPGVGCDKFSGLTPDQGSRGATNPHLCEGGDEADIVPLDFDD
jgi:hypothetical protein